MKLWIAFITSLTGKLRPFSGSMTSQRKMLAFLLLYHLHIWVSSFSIFSFVMLKKAQERRSRRNSGNILTASLLTSEAYQKKVSSNSSTHLRTSDSVRSSATNAKKLISWPSCFTSRPNHIILCNIYPPGYRYTSHLWCPWTLPRANSWARSRKHNRSRVGRYL